jgi:hypothetical protein
MPNKKYLEEKAKAEAELHLSSTNRNHHMLAHSEILRNGPNPYSSTAASYAGTTSNTSEVSASNEQGPSKKKKMIFPSQSAKKQEKKKNYLYLSQL